MKTLRDWIITGIAVFLFPILIIWESGSGPILIWVGLPTALAVGMVSLWAVRRDRG